MSLLTKFAPNPCQHADCSYRFGWVNASYIYALKIVNEHMKRALGAVVPWDTFNHMMKAKSDKEREHVLRKAAEDNDAAGKVHVAEHVRRTASMVSSPLPLSQEDQTAHMAIHGSAAERKVHHGPGETKTQ